MLRDLLYVKLKNTIQSFEEDLDDIYVVSLFVNNIDDDQSLCTIEVGYNTYSYIEPEELDDLDMKWNYANWIQNCEYIFGDPEEEDGTAEAIQEWIQENNYDLEFEEIIEGFIKEVIEAVKKLHSENIIINTFGRTIPVLIHELEYYDQIAIQNLEANPRECVEEFYQWIMDMK